MDYTEWSSLKVGDRVRSYYGKGTIVSNIGIGYVVQYDDGTKQRITDGSLRKIRDR